MSKKKVVYKKRYENSPVWKVPEDEFKVHVEKSSSYNAVVKKIGLKSGGFIRTVKNRIEILDLNVDHFNKKIVGNRHSPVWEVPKDKFIAYVKESYSYHSIIKKIGLKNGGFIATVKNRIEKLKLDTEHFDETKGYKEYSKKNYKSLKEILVKNSTYNNGNNLKKKLYKAELKEEICEICSIGPEWNGKELVLQIDHINGDHHDNRIENLRILCPNCHTQTDTFCSKNKKRYNKK